MRLAELLPGEDLAGAPGATEISALCCDSRKAGPGALFFAVPGTKADGLAFAPEAARRGAVAAVAGPGAPETVAGLPVVRVADVRAALALAAARFFPRQPETVVAVTGTSGKTSVAAFTRQIFARLGFSAASLGTLGVVAPSGAVYGSLTTPDPISLHETLDALAREGVTHLALEASSHGLTQRRLDGVRLAAGAFTNLSRDHLDYHPTMEAYLAAKLELFERLLAPGAPAVVDVDSEAGRQVAAACRARGLEVLSVGRAGETIRLLDAMPEPAATDLVISLAGRRRELRLPLAGAFQTSNALVAAGLALAAGGDADKALAALETLQGAPGRLEKIGERRGGAVYVDYAHKPDALEKALLALRPYASGRLIVVFGCGGDRDPGKRPIMGEIATRLADYAVVTDDNPRSETPAAIRAAILAGARGARNVVEIGDRAAAIAEGVGALDLGDILLIAGKGHETGQIVGDRVLPFSDAECARAALKTGER
ncbi:UDP-N-acetylmuramoyl-L-alanyl-D-glutamate--2,6-diaminopimelate ligase [Methylocella sp.]|uniref:UDP-N-acetylmuramoyl-L-alanyl-D-glutamate--2, 6-diaminopimelate ligase n=1 Tax=Methylocella sp. TaxID=1978226 RepID=UPI0037842056